MRSRGTYDTFVEFAIADLAEERGQDEATRRLRVEPERQPHRRRHRELESSLGWVGFAFYAAEQERMKAIEIDAGDGCVAPTPETIADGTYPFSRSLYIYVNKANAESNPASPRSSTCTCPTRASTTVTDAGYVDLPDDRLQRDTRGLGRPLTTQLPIGTPGPAAAPPGRTGHRAAHDHPSSSAADVSTLRHDAHGRGPAGQPQAAQPRAHRCAPLFGAVASRRSSSAC